MDTKNEAPMSVSSTLYYRGVSVLVTKRDPGAKVLPLIESQLKMIDWMLDEKDCKPSWNSQTNKEVEQENKDLGNCPKCGAPMKLSKQNKPYCSKVCWK